MKKLHKNIIVSGNVQGVGFRYSCFNTAHFHQILGYVKNLSNGNVYIEAEGTLSNLNLFIKWCHEGPGHANVSNLEISAGELCQYKSFELRN